MDDPTLQIGYWLPEQDRYVDSTGQPMAPVVEGDRVTTSIDRDGRRVAVLVHARGRLRDPAILDAIGRAAGLASTNARLQADVERQRAEVDASRRRLAQTADEEHRSLTHRLERVLDPSLAELDAALEDASSRLTSEPDRGPLAVRARDATRRGRTEDTDPPEPATDGEREIGRVENETVIGVAPGEVDEVGDRTIQRTVDEICDDPADQEADRASQQPAHRRAPQGEPEDEQGSDEDRPQDAAIHDGEGTVSVGGPQDPEGSDQVDPITQPDWRHRAQGERLADQGLAALVRDDHGRRGDRG